MGVEIKPAPDEWDRLYNVDFYIQVGEKYIGLQIKPISYEQTPEIYNQRFTNGKNGLAKLIRNLKRKMRLKRRLRDLERVNRGSTHSMLHRYLLRGSSKKIK